MGDWEGDLDIERHGLADYLAQRRGAILDAWQNAIRRDRRLPTGDVLPRAQLLDHIPDLLKAFEDQVRAGPSAPDAAQPGGPTLDLAAAHGLQRWQQGYDLREVTLELGKLNQGVVAELDGYTAGNVTVGTGTAIASALAEARAAWAAICGAAMEASVAKYYQLQQQEAAGHVKDLETAIADIRGLERERADLWRQAAHDLRGNLGVVANATVGLARGGLQEAARDDFVRILMRNVTSLHHLLDDVTSLARLQAGRELRQIEALDISAILAPLCEGIRPLAQQRRLFLRCEGPPGFPAKGDEVKIQRIAQNLILNAVKFTREGGISVKWGDSGAGDDKRWVLCVEDSGPGFAPGAEPPIGQALEGEGIGLSIVKRLCELLDATIEMQSSALQGTTFRVLFPREYPQ